MKEIIKLENIKRDFKVGDETVHALRGVSFTIYEYTLSLHDALPIRSEERRVGKECMHHT